MPSKKAKKKKVARPSVRYSTSEFERLLRQTNDQTHYVLKLYITGTTARSSAAIANIRSLCDEHLAGRYDLQVVDIYQQPSLAAGEQIIAAPTLVKELPSPVKRMVGDLSDRARILIGLDLRQAGVKEKPAKIKWTKI